MSHISIRIQVGISFGILMLIPASTFKFALLDLRGICGLLTNLFCMTCSCGPKGARCGRLHVACTAMPALHRCTHTGLAVFIALIMPCLQSMPLLLMGSGAHCARRFPVVLSILTLVLLTLVRVHSCSSYSEAFIGLMPVNPLQSCKRP